MRIIPRGGVLPVPLQTRRYQQHRQTQEPGLHVSAIIKHICRTLEPARFNRAVKHGAGAGYDLDSEPAIWLGQAVDQYLKRALLDEGGTDMQAMQVDGIWFSTDLMRLHTGIDTRRLGFPDDPTDEPIVEEFKLTWMSMRQPITDPKFRHWFWQLMAYCYVWETRRARLRVVAVNGDYGPPSPAYHVFDLLFSPAELADNWQMLQAHAARLRTQE